jgi:transposase-like protein
MNCPECESEQIVKNGKIKLQDQTPIQKYLCNACGKQFNERTGTPMARLRTPAMVVSLALSVRTEGMGVRATGRSFGKSHSTILKWEQRLAMHLEQWSPPAPDGSDVTLEGDEVYTRVGENLPPLRLRRLDDSLH